MAAKAGVNVALAVGGVVLVTIGAIALAPRASISGQGSASNAQDVASPGAQPTPVANTDDAALAARLTPRQFLPWTGAMGDDNRVLALGFDFAWPWPAVARTTNMNGGVRMVSDTGKGVFMRPLMNPVDWEAQFPGLEPAVKDPIAALTGYALYEAIFSATPAQLASSPSQAARLKVLLALKDGLASNAETGLYSFATDDFRGFQLGQPERSAHIDIYGFPKDGPGVQISFFVDKGMDERVTQQEVDRVLSTMKWKAPAPR